MIWLTWRQFRAQVLTAAGVMAAAATYLVVLGLQVRDSYDDVLGCAAAGTCETAGRLFLNDYRIPVNLAGLLLIAAPGVIGAFWGAPLITRELEAGTHRLVWNQSVTRTRWLAVKLGLIALVSAVVAGLFSLLLTWAVSPYDQAKGTRFAAAVFDSRNVVPVGYAVFAFLLGTVAGLLIRRTLPAMAVTLAVFAVLQVAIPFTIRPQLQSPVTTTVAFSRESAERAGFLGFEGDGDQAKVFDYAIPGAWTLSSANDLLTASGGPVTRDTLKSCDSGDFGTDMACLGEKNLHFDVTYHPASRYWTFQWIELSGFLVAAAGLAGLGIWRVRQDFG